MRFLIDGYNLLHHLGLAGRHLGPRAWERSRNDLLQWLAKVHAGKTDQVTVVFDGDNAPEKLPQAGTFDGIHFFFARDGKADDLIDEMIHREPQPKRTTVISNDQRVLTAAQRRSCIAMGCNAYIDWALDQGQELPRPKRREKPDAGDDSKDWISEFADIDADPDLRRHNRPFEDFERDREKP
jgi:hypothetical protein